MTNSAKLKLFSVLFGTVSIMLASASAAAQSSQSIVVSTVGLDLTGATGQKRLKLRLMQAVSENCPIGAKCREAALANVYAQADKLIEAAKSGMAVPDTISVPAR